MFRKILFFFITFNSIAYTAQISDALHKLIPDSARPKNKNGLTLEEKRSLLFGAHVYTRDFRQHFRNELDEIANELLQQANVSHDKATIVKNYDVLSVYHRYSDNPAVGLDPYEKYSDVLIETGPADTVFAKEVGYAFIHKGFYSLNRNKYEDAAMKFQTALQCFQMVGDTAGLWVAHSNLGLLYSFLYLYDKSLEEQQHALTCIKVAGWEKGLGEYFSAENYMRRAHTYFTWFEREQKPALLDSAWFYLSRVPGKEGRSERFVSYHHFLKGYGHFLKGNYETALDELDSSISHLDYYSRSVAVKEVYRGLTLLKLGQRKKAAEILLAVRGMDVGHGVSENLYKALYQYAMDCGQYKTALRYFETSKLYKDSAGLMAQRGEVLAVVQKYTLAKKENQIVQLQLENGIIQAEKKYMTLTFVLVGIFLVAAIILLFTINRDRKLRAMEANAEPDCEKRNVEDMLRLQDREVQHVRKKSLLNLRRQISRDLHDGLSSALIGLKYYVNDMRSNAKTEEEKNCLMSIEQEVESVYIQARSYMHNLNTGIDEAVGNLNPFLTNIFQDLSRNNNVDIKFNYNKEEVESKLSLVQQNQLTLMLKEATSNILKHADASRIEVNISFENTVCRFSILDNGRGFSKKSNGGIGMSSMQQRIRRIKGNIYIDSSSAGTRLSGDFPLNV